MIVDTSAFVQSSTESRRRRPSSNGFTKPTSAASSLMVIESQLGQSNQGSGAVIGGIGFLCRVACPTGCEAPRQNGTQTFS